MAISYPAGLPEEKFNRYLEHIPVELRESGKYFDYLDLIDLGMAIEVTEENNPYEKA